MHPSRKSPPEVVIRVAPICTGTNKQTPDYRSDTVITAKATDCEAASVVCDMNSPQLRMTYHAAGELLQGGAAALLSVCCLLFWEGVGKQGECLGQVWRVMQLVSRSK